MSPRRTTRIARAALALALAVLGAACESENGADTTQVPNPDGSLTGTVSWDGVVSELDTDDFLICETANPASPGEFNVSVELPDGTLLYMVGNVDDYSGDSQGLFLGEPPDDRRAEDLSLSLEGRTLAGQAETAEGPIEFIFDC